MDMDFPITQLSEAKFVSGVRAFNSIGIKRNCLRASAEWSRDHFAKKHRSEAKIGSPATAGDYLNKLSSNIIMTLFLLNIIYRNFKVISVSKHNTKEIMPKRVVIRDSGHPSNSKW